MRLSARPSTEGRQGPSIPFTAVGLIPESSADVIAATCRGLKADAEDLLAKGWDQGAPMLPLLDLIWGQIPDDQHPHLHLDSTTQDIVDTALTWRAAQGIARLGDATEEVGWSVPSWLTSTRVRG